ncbi:sugar ABC transporter ATP-binding protein, partial [Intrasporangium calvum]
PGVVALDGVDFEVRPGEVMALVGENGAGKSTLLKILAGAEHADEGTIEVDGAPVQMAHPREAQRHGIAVIYQELNLAEHLSVAENIFVGREPRNRLGGVDWRRMNARTRDLLRDLRVVARPETIVGRLNVATRQMVEIAKALSMDARVIVMDEPTSSLTEQEVQTLLQLVRELRSKGVSVIYVSHRMREIFEVSDRITVMRDGRLVGVRDAAGIKADEIVTMMVGRELTDLYGGETRGAVTAESPILTVEGLNAGDRVKDVSFSVRPGEIVGFAGLIGAGRSETAHAIFGSLPRTSGTVTVAGAPIAPKHPDDAIRHGVVLVPEDRKREGLFLGLPVRTNIASPSLKRLSRWVFVKGGAEGALARESAKRLNLRSSAVDVPVRTLSGGNQQKVVLARWLALNPKVLLLDEPTRGVDVGAKAELYRIIRSVAREGVGVVVISSELPEVLGICDRILVMREGRVVGELDAATATEEAVMSLATGVSEAKK